MVVWERLGRWKIRMGKGEGFLKVSGTLNLHRVGSLILFILIQKFPGYLLGSRDFGVGHSDQVAN